MKRFAIEINGRYCYDYQTKGRVVVVWDLLTGDFYDAKHCKKMIRYILRALLACVCVLVCAASLLVMLCSSGGWCLGSGVLFLASFLGAHVAIMSE